MVSFHFTPPENHGKGTNPKSRRDRRRRQQLFEAQRGLCHWCREPMEMNHFRKTQLGRWKENPLFASFEHLIPKSHGGTGVRKNILLAHADCNGKRALRCWPHDPIYGVQPVPTDTTNDVMKAAFDKARTHGYIGPAPGWRR